MRFLWQRKGVAQQLYEQNLELATRNKVLSLFENLYQISVLNLSSEKMAQEISCAIYDGLNIEVAHIFMFDKKNDSLLSIGFCASDRFQEAIKESGIDFENIKIPEISKNRFLTVSLASRHNEVANSLNDVFSSAIEEKKLNKINEKSNIKTVLMAPLKIEQGVVLGALLLGFNRGYDDLTSFEKEAIKNFNNLIGLIIYKTFLYRDLQSAYDVERQQREKTEAAYKLEKEAKLDLERLSKAKSEFISIVSHQLRTPLTAVKGYISLILEGSYGGIPDPIKRPLENVYKSNQRLVDLVNDLLSVSRIESGKIKLEPREASIEEIVNGVVFDTKVNAEKKKLYLKVQKPAKSMGNMMLDLDKMRQVVLNLVDNAVKYTEKGGITIKLELKKPKEKTSNAGEKLLISISDTGGGISKDEIDTIFNSFSRGKVGQTTFTEGVGLGLYIVREFVKMHEGVVWVESEGEGKGSVFFVEIPVKRS